MNHLKSLTLTVNPSNTAVNPILARRTRLVEHLEEQRKLAKDPNYAPAIRQWKKAEDGSRTPVDSFKIIKPWWRLDANGSLVLLLKSGLKTLELDKGKPGIVVGAPERLDAILTTLISATKAGELDKAMELAAPVSGGPTRKKK